MRHIAYNVKSEPIYHRLIGTSVSSNVPDVARDSSGAPLAVPPYLVIFSAAADIQPAHTSKHANGPISGDEDK